MTDTIKNLEWRYATKKYDVTKKLSLEQRKVITESLRLSPSSLGIQPWTFVHVVSPDLREKLKAAGYGQSPITDASDLFVLCAKTTLDEEYVDKFISFVSNVQGVPVENLAGYKKMIMGSVSKPETEKAEWMTRQVYIALGVALAVAAENRIDATPMEGFDPKVFDEILGLKKLGLASKVLLAVGFSAEDDEAQKQKKVRFDIGEIFIEK
jgi:nitroreductase